MMRCSGLTAILILTGVVSVPAQDHPPEAIGTRVFENDGVRVHEAILPGELIDWSLVEKTAAPSALALLLEVEAAEDSAEAHRELWIWSPGDDGALAKQGSDLPAAAAAIIPLASAADGGVAVAVTVATDLWGLSQDGGWSRRFEFSDELFPVRTVRGGRGRTEGSTVLRSVGALRSFGSAPSPGQLQPEWEQELPVAIERRRHSLVLTTPAVHLLGSASEGSQTFLVGPEPQGSQRVRSWQFAAAAGGQVESIKMWSVFSQPEEIQESWYVWFNDEPALVVTTLLANQHGVFEKKKLRLFELSADRTRSGTGPLLEVMTRTRNWYSTCAWVADVNDDGLDDVVSAQPKGLGAGKLWVEVHLGSERGGFESRARTTELAVEEGEICTLSSDVNGDTLVDLVVIESDSLLVFELVRAEQSEQAARQTPLWRVDLPSLEGRPSPVEIFPDEPSQMLVEGRTEGGKAAVRVLRFRDAAAN